MDKQVTRWARMGYGRVTMFGRVWELDPTKQYHVKYDRKHAGKSTIEEVN